MRIPEQAEPVARSVSHAQRPQAEVRPQTCWCIDSDGDGQPTWHCESGRELFDTYYNC